MSSTIDTPLESNSAGVPPAGRPHRAAPANLEADANPTERIRPPVAGAPRVSVSGDRGGLAPVDPEGEDELTDLDAPPTEKMPVPFVAPELSGDDLDRAYEDESDAPDTDRMQPGPFEAQGEIAAAASQGPDPADR
jgi:hypothetical protein